LFHRLYLQKDRQVFLLNSDSISGSSIVVKF